MGAKYIYLTLYIFIFNTTQIRQRQCFESSAYGCIASINCVDRRRQSRRSGKSCVRINRRQRKSVKAASRPISAMSPRPLSYYLFSDMTPSREMTFLTLIDFINFLIIYIIIYYLILYLLIIFIKNQLRFTYVEQSIKMCCRN